MARGRKRKQAKASSRGTKILREEQGDLLAEAVSEVMAREEEEEGVVEGPAEPLEEEPRKEEPRGEEAEPGVEGRAEASGPGEGSPSAQVAEIPEAGEAATEPIAEGPPVIPESPFEQKLAWARERVREGRVEDAMELYLELVEEDPTSVRALNNLGVLLDERGDHEKALVRFRAARDLDPDNLEILGNLGATLGALGRYSEAEEELRRGLRLDPANVEIRANLGILFFRRGLYQQAAEELGVVCHRDPDQGLAHLYRGEALNRVGRVDEAVEALLRVTELLPRNPRAYHTLGMLFDKKRLPEEAARMYRKARELGNR